MFRFTIRELVLLTLVVAMGVGWWLDRRSLSNDVRELEWSLKGLVPAEEPSLPPP